ncbi:MAG: Rpn family recombination-promoting nuclease/putative transposase [Wolbachia endosymbiont of Tyrophagus putrescentiae]|nr:Rpn family recombination-promoting nuclease/putative transposase [Wolbachia endosymbiont of Tyrophagus putrescentiae]
MAFSKFLDPKNDVSFKRIFGTEKNKDILIHFLNDILINDTLAHLELQKIQEVEFLSTVQDPDIAAKKQSIVDVLCRDINGTQYIIEMQVAKTKGFEKRAQYYAAKAYSRQAEKGDQYYNLKEIIFIAIADYLVFPNKTGYLSYHSILDMNTYESNLKDFCFVFIELPKFSKTREDELSNIVEKWAYFFRYAAETRESDLERIIGSDEIIKRAYKELDRFNWSDIELRTYEQEVKRILDEQAILAQKLDDAREEGIKIGAERGKIEIAKSMLANNIDVNTVAKFTGLSIPEIKKL